MNEVRREPLKLEEFEEVLKAYNSEFYSEFKRQAADQLLASYRTLVARVQEVERAAKWKYCAECGCNEYRELDCGERVCMSCGQSWFVDVQYHTAVRANLSSLRQQLAEAQGTIARQQEQLRLCNIDQLQAEQQMARLRESSNDLVEFFTQNHEDVGEELYGRVNGEDLTPSAKRLNEMLTEMQHALRETGA